MDKIELKACEYTIHRLVKEMLRTNTKAIHGTYTDDENKEYEVKVIIDKKGELEQ